MTPYINIKKACKSAFNQNLKTMSVYGENNVAI